MHCKKSIQLITKKTRRRKKKKKGSVLCVNYRNHLRFRNEVEMHDCIQYDVSTQAGWWVGGQSIRYCAYQQQLYLGCLKSGCRLQKGIDIPLPIVCYRPNRENRNKTNRTISKSMFPFYNVMERRWYKYVYTLKRRITFQSCTFVLYLLLPFFEYRTHVDFIHPVLAEYKNL